MSANRSAIRNQLATLLQNALVGEGKPCQAVYAYQPATFDGQSPVVTVSSAGSSRVPFTHQGNRSKFALYIHVFVLYADAESGWDEQDAEDRLDLIEAMIADVLATSRRHEGFWEDMTASEPSSTLSAEIGGDEYRVEVINIDAEVYA